MEIDTTSELFKAINDIKETSEKWNYFKNEVRKLDLSIKTKKLNLEFDKEFTDGLKVKEIPHKIHNEILSDLELLNDLKAKRDNAEMNYELAKIHYEYLKLQGEKNE